MLAFLQTCTISKEPLDYSNMQGRFNYGMYKPPSRSLSQQLGALRLSFEWVPVCSWGPVPSLWITKVTWAKILGLYVLQLTVYLVQWCQYQNPRPRVSDLEQPGTLATKVLFLHLNRRFLIFACVRLIKNLSPFFARSTLKRDKIMELARKWHTSAIK